MGSLAEDPRLSFIISCLVEFPSYVAVALALDLLGRKPIFSSALILSGVSCLSAGFVSKGLLRQLFAFCAKFFASMAFDTAYLYTAELYPTSMRNTAIGACSTIARLGAIAAPFTVLYLPKVAPDWLPLALIGTFSCAGGLLALLLPETLGSRLPESLADVELMKKNSNAMSFCRPCVNSA